MKGFLVAKYLSLNAVKARLEGKVKFAAIGELDSNKVSDSLLKSLVLEAETQLEIDLMQRYEVPFQSEASGTFESIPLSTKTFITTLAELLSVIRILETDFGRGTSANSEKYTEKLQKRYDAMISQLIEIKEGERKSYGTWLRPPLQGLKLAYSNQGDTGFRGRVHNTTSISHHADYAYQQINNPGENFFTGWLDPLDIGRGE